MTALYIILSVIVFILILLLLPVTIYVEYKEKLFVKIKYLFITYKIPKTQKKQKKKIKSPQKKDIQAKNESSKKEKSAISKLIEQRGLFGFINLIKDLAKIITEELKTVFLHMIIKRMEIIITVGGENAADTAMNYGYLCMALYPALSVISGNVKKIKSQNIKINSDFAENSKTDIKAEVKAKVKLIWALKSIIRAVLKSKKFF